MQKNFQLKKILSIGSVFVVFSFIYFPMLPSVPFSWDDRELILDNPVVTLRNWKQCWMQAFIGNYMPLSMTILAFLFYLHPTLWILHVASLILHILNAMGIYYLINKWSNSFFLAFFSTAAFLLHPMQTESLCWASEFRTPLSYFFLILSLVLLALRNPCMPEYFGSFFFFLCALLSKPVAVVYPVCVWILYKKKLKKEIIFIIIISSLVSIGFSCLTYFLQYEQGYISHSKNLPLVFRVPHASYLLGKYIFLTLFPFRLSVCYPFSVRIKWFLVLGLIFMIFLIYVFLKSKSSSEEWKKYFLLSVVLLLPTLQIVSFGQVPMADRYAYMFIPFFSAAICEWIKKFFNVRIVSVFFLVWILILTVLTMKRLALWKDPLLLFMDAHRKYPDSYLINNTLGVEYMNRNMDYLAGQYLKRSVELAPFTPEIRYNLSLWYIKMNRFRDAHKELYYSYTSLPFHFKTLVLLAEMENLKENYNVAEKMILKAISMNPMHARCWFVLGNTMMGKGNFRQAQKCYLKAIHFMPRMADFHFKLGMACFLLNDFAGSMEAFHHAIKQDSLRGEYYYHRGLAKQKLKKNPCEDFLKAARLQYPPAMDKAKEANCP